jgi:site-specific recombinase XerD
MLKDMSNRYNFFYFEAEFRKYLIAGNAEPSTIKNYLSDLHFFFSWIKNTQSISDLAYSELPEVFSHSLIRMYYSYLESSTNASQTMNRRLSTARKFFKLCVDQQWIQNNPMDQLDKSTKSDEKEEIVLSYRNNLQAKSYSKSDIDRHINIVRSLIINSNIL